MIGGREPAALARDPADVVRGRYRLEAGDFAAATAVHPSMRRTIAIWWVFVAIAAIHIGSSTYMGVPFWEDRTLLISTIVLGACGIALRSLPATILRSRSEAQRELSIEVRDTGIRIADANGEARTMVWSTARGVVVGAEHVLVIYPLHAEAIPRRAFAPGDFDRVVAMARAKVGSSPERRDRGAPPRSLLVLGLWVVVISILYAVYQLTTDR